MAISLCNVEGCAAGVSASGSSMKLSNMRLQRTPHRGSAEPRSSWRSRRKMT